MGLRTWYREKRAKRYEGKTQDQLVRASNHYTRSISSSGSSSYIAVLFSGITCGISLIPLAVSVPTMWHAYHEKRHIKKLFRAQGHEYRTRKRDIFLGAAVGVPLSIVTQGVGNGMLECGDTAWRHATMVTYDDAHYLDTMKEEWTVHKAAEEAGKHGFRSGVHAGLVDVAVQEGKCLHAVGAEAVVLPVGSAAEATALGCMRSVATRDKTLPVAKARA